MHSDFVRYEVWSPRELRGQLLEFAGEFVRQARELAGVVRLAMLGSIVTPKGNPKDIDVLVTVTDACDLAPLAKLGRRLRGRAQGLNHGADVFLASPKGVYLGRTCQWRECRPGMRVACDARRCGGRPFLHDDLGTVMLPHALIAAPPLDLHPAIFARVALPSDIESWLTTIARAGAT
jgi:hypothetical protein